jgi:hypothetical protein
MTLPAAYATISMGDINVELGRSRTSTISLNTAENGGYVTINTNSTSRPSSSDPASISEWYSYNHNASPPSTPPTFGYNLIRQGPTNGVLTITKNGSTVVSTSTTGASGTVSVANGDVMVMTITSSPKVEDTTTLYLYNQNGLLDAVVTYEGTSTLTWTMANNNQYTLYAEQIQGAPI